MDLSRLLEIGEEIRKQLGDLVSLAQLSLLYLVALQPGITNVEAAKRLNMPRGSISRNASKLSKYSRYGRDQGYGLIEQKVDFAVDSRRHALYLTKDGETFIKMIKSMLGNDEG